MSRQEQSLQSQGGDANVVGDELQHILIPACALGVDGYRQFRAANPDWRPESPSQQSIRNENLKKCPSCQECLANISKHVSLKSGLIREGSLGGPMKVLKPMDISLTNAKDKPRPMALSLTNAKDKPKPMAISLTDAKEKSKVATVDKAISFQTVEIIKPQGTTTAEPLVMKMVVKPIVREVAMEVKDPRMKASAREDYASGIKTQCTGVITPARRKASEHTNVSSGMDTVSQHTTSSQELSESTMTPSQMEAGNWMDHEGGHSHDDDNVIEYGTSRGDTPMMNDDEEELFTYIVSTRNIPKGASLSSLDIGMQKRLQQYFKTHCPPCPHCNSNAYVKFRYFNNSGKSSLLQPRYTCRNPETCVTVQEKSGRAGSRDFPLPKAKEVDFPSGHLSRLPAQVLPRARSKRPAQDLNNSMSEMGERSSKLPNTTLTLHTSNAATADKPTMQLRETAKERNIGPLGKPLAEDTHSSSSTRTASDQHHRGINVQYLAEASSENGRLVAQPISFQKVANKTDTVTVEGSKRKGNITEFNICMYIDLSGTSSS